MPVTDDPLVRMPGTQPGQVALEGPRRCLNCHGDYDAAAEPSANWQGSMMAQAARDFLFWACMTVAGQDSIWAVGRPNAVDICERCHFPKGWLEGRSDPPNASLMSGADYDGIQCDFCHRMYDPFFEETYSGEREGSDWLNYWDEAELIEPPSSAGALVTRDEDRAQALTVGRFNGQSFYNNYLPPVGYSENGAGQYFVSADDTKRASFADASPRHAMFYSRYHKSRYFCAACHDVSNPALHNLDYVNLPPGDGSTVLPTELESAYAYFHVERTFSEFMLSAYGQDGGAPGIGPYAPEVFETSYDNNYVAKCQDCHLPDVRGAGAQMNDAVLRPDESVEHPQSGQPVHDMTGGNAWVSWVLASAVPGAANHDPVNEALLSNPTALTLDLNQGEGIDPVALLAGVDRAKQQLHLAASLENMTYDPLTGDLAFRIQNQTGHKLISGFPEGRRMFINIQAKDAAGNVIYEVNPYDPGAGTLKGLSYPYSTETLDPPDPIGTNEVYVDELVYEMHPSSALTGEEETFHFALATNRHKDNRIPPKGFQIDPGDPRLVMPRWHGADAPGYFTPEESAGGHDDIALADYANVSFPAGATSVEINLFYQTTSREYMEFLRDEIRGSGNLTLRGPDNPTPAGSHTLAYELGLNPDDDDAYLVQNDPFFARLAGWGNTIWQLWTHNRNVPGAAPFLMTSQQVSAPEVSSLSLLTGWNLIAGRLSPLPDAETALDEIAAQGGSASELHRWLSVSDTWDGHIKDLPFSNFPMELGQGYFVKAAAASTWQRAGISPLEPVPVALNPVWTLIGLPKMPGPMTAEDLLQEASGQGGDCTEIYRWNSELGAWEGHVRGLPFGNFDLTTDEGYFLKCSQAIIYVPGGGVAPERADP